MDFFLVKLLLILIFFLLSEINVFLKNYLITHHKTCLLHRIIKINWTGICISEAADLSVEEHNTWILRVMYFVL